MFTSARIRRMHQATEEELNLVPFLDVMVVLIPFLMFSASFATIVALPTSLPAPVASLPTEMRPPFDLVAQASPDSLRILVNPGTPQAEPVVSLPTPGSGDYDEATKARYHQTLVAIKRAHPGETRLALDAAPGLSLQRISTLMDLSRDLVPTDTGIQAAAGQKARSLFPQVALKGVYVP